MAVIKHSIDNTVSFSRRKLASQSFQSLYDEGMTLVEETATYLDGIGREEAKCLRRAATSLYAAESMRLTTRLMQISSWLLLHRAQNTGEVSDGQVEDERSKIRLDTVSADRSTVGWDELPQPFLKLIARSLRLQHRVTCLDAELYSDEYGDEETDANPVNAQIALLRTAFGG
ncbi:MAG: DUF1465 family protein [Pseudomonadota bacterium]